MHIVVKSSIYDVVLEDIKVEADTWVGEDGHTYRRTIYHTPSGTLQAVDSLHPHLATEWREEVPFRGPEDYDALIALVESRRFVPRFDRFLADDAKYGASGSARPATEATPMRELIYQLLGVENFAFEWFDHRDHLMALYNALLDARRRKLPMMAESPAVYFIVAANVAFDVVGPQRFTDLYVPVIEEACDILHASGKLTGAHLDGNNRLLAPLVADTSLDFIESFTPPPDCDLTISEARQVWPDKVLYCNFPSSLHLRGPEVVRAQVKKLLAEAAPGQGFLLGVMENVARNDTLVTLAECVRDFGETPMSF
jgi:hypothetical protein